ncbi:MAG TPA: hypothetical protein VFF69_04185 [Phycisphaerales bacterium]|nr:hypothetical protein [Phycisphaerales bacterium]
MTTPSASHLTLRLPLLKLGLGVALGACVGAAMGAAAAGVFGLGAPLHAGPALAATLFGLPVGLALLWAAGPRPILAVAGLVLASSFLRSAIAIGLTFAAVRTGGLDKSAAMISALLACVGALIAETRIVNDHIRAAGGATTLQTDPVHG